MNIQLINVSVYAVLGFITGRSLILGVLLLSFPELREGLLTRRQKWLANTAKVDERPENWQRYYILLGAFNLVIGCISLNFLLMRALIWKLY